MNTGKPGAVQLLSPGNDGFRNGWNDGGPIGNLSRKKDIDAKRADGQSTKISRRSGSLVSNFTTLGRSASSRRVTRGWFASRTLGSFALRAIGRFTERTASLISSDLPKSTSGRDVHCVRDEHTHDHIRDPRHRSSGRCTEAACIDRTQAAAVVQGRATSRRRSTMPSLRLIQEVPIPSRRTLSHGDKHSRTHPPGHLPGRARCAGAPGRRGRRRDPVHPPTARYAACSRELGVTERSVEHLPVRPGRPGGWWIIFEPELHLGEDILVPDLAGGRRERMPDYPDTAYVTLPPD